MPTKKDDDDDDDDDDDADDDDDDDDDDLSMMMMINHNNLQLWCYPSTWMNVRSHIIFLAPHHDTLVAPHLGWTVLSAATLKPRWNGTLQNDGL